MCNQSKCLKTEIFIIIKCTINSEMFQYLVGNLRKYAKYKKSISIELKMILSVFCAQGGMLIILNTLSRWIAW